MSVANAEENEENNKWKVFQAHINCPSSSDKLVNVEQPLKIKKKLLTVLGVNTMQVIRGKKNGGWAVVS